MIEAPYHGAIVCCQTKSRQRQKHAERLDAAKKGGNNMTVFLITLAALFVLSTLSLAGSAVRFVAAYERAHRWQR